MSGLAARKERPEPKALGAFYTEESAVNRLVEWAIRDRNAVVLDPSCGDGAFLAAASARLAQFGSSSFRLHGIDVSADALRESRQRVRNARLVLSDFFDLTPQSLPAFDCVVGNPPYIRYQTFNGDSTSKAHTRAMEAGVQLPRLAASWAPFVVHSARFLRPGGRLAMVMPSELGHAMYAREVLKYLVRHFKSVAIQMFRDKLFDGLGQSTVLLFCDGYGEVCREFTVTSADNLQSGTGETRTVDCGAIEGGKFRLSHYLLPDAVRSLYETLAVHPRVRRLGEVADVGIGYVTGANDFFHLSDDERRQWKIGDKFLRAAALNLRDVEGIAFRRDQWTSRLKAGEKVHLLALPAVPKGSLPVSVQRYLYQGEISSVSDRYKCRTRRFWYVVPHVRVADAFLSYMSGEMPRLVTNAAGLVAPNTIHLVRFLKGCDPNSYAAAWRNSLTRLSCEMEGHALGGGLFKVEPSEAERILVVAPSASHAQMLFNQCSRDLTTPRDRDFDLFDRHLLRKEMGLTEAECVSLREAAARMEQWRKHL
ncbi:MAG: class I SAM-dependent DNA methyltransferase [Candidatus Binataceae bacterium]